MLQTGRPLSVFSTTKLSSSFGIPRSVRPSFRLLPLPAVALAFLAAVAGFAPTAASQEAADPGYQRTYTIHADACWLPGGRVVEPAFVTIDKGRIAGVSTRAPRERNTPFGVQKPTILRVEGTLAPAIVDAWSGLV